MDDRVRYRDRFTREAWRHDFPAGRVRAEARRDDGFDTTVPAGQDGLHWFETARPRMRPFDHCRAIGATAFLR